MFADGCLHEWSNNNNIHIDENKQMYLFTYLFICLYFNFSTIT